MYRNTSHPEGGHTELRISGHRSHHLGIQRRGQRPDLATESGVFADLEMFDIYIYMYIATYGYIWLDVARYG